MYAIIDDSGCQMKVEEGQQIDVDLRSAELSPGDTVAFERVLALRDDGGLRIGRPLVDGARVTAEIVERTKGPKLTVQKVRRRKNSRRKTGHRQAYHRVKITKIDAP